MRLWIDTDVGDNPDDAVALLCAASHPEVELVGVSTVDGDTAWRAQVVRGLVDAPVVAGGSEYVRSGIEAARPDAVLAIGPLTNIAAALEGGSSLPPLTLMGGTARATRHRGHVQQVEHNFSADPLAARAVLRDTVGTRVVPLDVTASMTLDADDERRLVTAAPELSEHLERWRATTIDAPLVLHDPVALLAACNEPVVQFKERHLVVDRDGRLVQRADGPLHRIAVSGDSRGAIKRVLSLLS